MFSCNPVYLIAFYKATVGMQAVFVDASYADWKHPVLFGWLRLAEIGSKTNLTKNQKHCLKRYIETQIEQIECINTTRTLTGCSFGAPERRVCTRWIMDRTARTV